MTSEPTRADCEARDAADPLAAYRAEFLIDDDALIYLDGNSLGRLPTATLDRVRRVLEEEWGGRLIRSWRETWMELPTRLGDLIGTGLLGAQPGETVVADNTTVSLYKAISAALDARPGRRALLIERDNFPTDRYVVESLAQQRDLEIRWVDEVGSDGITVEDLGGALDTSVAVVILSHVDYRSAAILDMASLTSRVHDVGALAVWDLCHSVGAVPIDLHEAGADIAVGCTYKYLNSGPGAPAFTFVSGARQAELAQPIWGWWGRVDMFDMAQDYLPQPDIRAWLTGTPSILSMVGVETAVEMVVRAGITEIRRKSVALTSMAVSLYDAWLADRGVGLASPRDAARRGSHVTVTHPDAMRLADDLAVRDVIPDFRRPDGIRLGLAPLTTRFVDVYDGLAVLRDTLD
ncbi:MAG: kynureninase [Actinomycetota bacterium]|jgi:kynureninase|nr:kynureninase [Actinomycetota bacterium]